MGQRLPGGELAGVQTPKVMTDLLRGPDCKVWVKVPSVPVRSVAVHSPCDADVSLPSADVILAAQRKAVADLGDNLRSFPTTFGQVTLADDDLFRLRVGNRDVLWIPSGDQALQVRLMVCAHMQSAGHRGVLPTLFRLKEYCVWSHMESDVREFVRQRLHCVDTVSYTHLTLPTIYSV